MNLSVSKVLLAGAVTSLLVCCMATTALASELNAGIGTVDTAALKMRAEASNSAACLTLLPKDTTVLVENNSNADWYQIYYKGEVGYLSSEYVVFSETGDAELGNGIVTGNDVNVRASATTKAAKVGSLNSGDVVSIIGVDSGWFKITYNDVVGYIRSDFMDPTTKDLTEIPDSVGLDIVEYAKQFMGCRYVWGAASGKTFDCSGFTLYVMNHFGVSLPHSAAMQLSYGTAVEKSMLEPGDLVFFRDPSVAGKKAASHVGIYIGNNQFIHASSGGGKVQIDSLSKNYYTKYYTGARRMAE